MKKLICLFSLILFLSVNAQNVNDFKYIVIPSQFLGFDENQYELNRYLGIQLIKKNYEILSGDSEEWPAEVQQNPCLALNAMVTKEKNFLKNKLTLKFTDCTQKVVFEKEGESKIKEFDKGYQDALKQITNSIALQTAADSSVIAQNTEETTETNFQSGEFPEPQLNTVNLFSDGKNVYSKSDLKDNSFLLINESNAQVFAQFYPSSKTGIYHVKINQSNGESYFTIGFTNQNSIEIEVQNGNGQWTLKSFKPQ